MGLLVSHDSWKTSWQFLLHCNMLRTGTSSIWKPAAFNACQNAKRTTTTAGRFVNGRFLFSWTFSGCKRCHYEQMVICQIFGKRLTSPVTWWRAVKKLEQTTTWMRRCILPQITSPGTSLSRRHAISNCAESLTLLDRDWQVRAKKGKNKPFLNCYIPLKKRNKKFRIWYHWRTCLKTVPGVHLNQRNTISFDCHRCHASVSFVATSVLWTYIPVGRSLLFRCTSQRHPPISSYVSS